MRKGVSAAQNIAFLKSPANTVSIRLIIFSVFLTSLQMPTTHLFDRSASVPSSTASGIRWRESPLSPHNNPERFGIEPEPNPYYKMLYLFEMADQKHCLPLCAN